MLLLEFAGTGSSFAIHSDDHQGKFLHARVGFPRLELPMPFPNDGENFAQLTADIASGTSRRMASSIG